MMDSRVTNGCGRSESPDHYAVEKESLLRFICYYKQFSILGQYGKKENSHYI